MLIRYSLHFYYTFADLVQKPASVNAPGGYGVLGRGIRGFTKTQEWQDIDVSMAVMQEAL